MKYFAYCRKSSEGEERQALSIPAQIDEIKRLFAGSSAIEITEWFEEKMSAKAPGRPVYTDMIKRIERGEADGIVAWHPDRLARNSVDGGWIVHLLDRRVLKDLKFVSYSYEHSPQGMFMLQIMFGQSKYYVDNLSVNVKRGMRKKIELGWLPNKAPLGYRNDKETGTIVRDPERFPLVQQMWNLLLTGAYRVRQINLIANGEWGLRTPRSKKSGGRPLSLAGTYRLFGNPFYAGVIDWHGEWRPGKHNPMITLEQFDRVQEILGRKDRPRPKTHAFAFTGLIRCSCGLAVTAEEKIKLSGRRYIYYHCTRRVRPQCRQPAVRLEVLERQITDFLRSIRLPTYVERQLRSLLERSDTERQATQETQNASAVRALDRLRHESRTLTDLRLRELIDDVEFVERRNALQKDELRLQQAALHNAANPVSGLELAENVVLFRKCAADWFSAGTLEEKRIILQTAGSNPILIDRKLSIQARFPFKPVEDLVDCRYQRAVIEDVGTSPGHKADAIAFIECTKYLKACADARKAHRPRPPLSDCIKLKWKAPHGRASWRPEHLREAA